MGAKKRNLKSLTASEVATLFGVTTVRVSQLASEGFFPFEGPRGHRRYDTGKVMTVKAIADRERKKIGGDRIPWINVAACLIGRHDDEFPDVRDRALESAKRVADGVISAFQNMRTIDGRVFRDAPGTEGRANVLREDLEVVIKRERLWRIIEGDEFTDAELEREVIAELKAILVELEEGSDG